jgi:hypothetical protein
MSAHLQCKATPQSIQPLNIEEKSEKCPTPALGAAFAFRLDNAASLANDANWCTLSTLEDRPHGLSAALDRGTHKIQRRHAATRLVAYNYTASTAPLTWGAFVVLWQTVSNYRKF